jgi:starch synthase (maltosyl-transferring)
MALSAPHWFYRNAGADIIDPRQVQLGPEALPARFDDSEREQQLTAWWTDRIVRLANAGAAGFRLLGLADVPARF